MSAAEPNKPAASINLADAYARVHADVADKFAALKDPANQVPERLFAPTRLQEAKQSKAKIHAFLREHNLSVETMDQWPGDINADLGLLTSFEQAAREHVASNVKEAYADIDPAYGAALAQRLMQADALPQASEVMAVVNSGLKNARAVTEQSKQAQIELRAALLKDQEETLKRSRAEWDAEAQKFKDEIEQLKKRAKTEPATLAQTTPLSAQPPPLGVPIEAAASSRVGGDTGFPPLAGVTWAPGPSGIISSYKNALAPQPEYGAKRWQTYVHDATFKPSAGHANKA